MLSTDLRSAARSYILQYLQLTDAILHIFSQLIGNRVLPAQGQSSLVHSGGPHCHKGSEGSGYRQDRKGKMLQMWNLHHGL